MDVDFLALDRDGAVLAQLDAGGAALQQDFFAVALGGLDQDVAARGLLVVPLDGLRQVGADAGVLPADDNFFLVATDNLGAKETDFIDAEAADSLVQKAADLAVLEKVDRFDFVAVDVLLMVAV